MGSHGIKVLIVLYLVCPRGIELESSESSKESISDLSHEVSRFYSDETQKTTKHQQKKSPLSTPNQEKKTPKPRSENKYVPQEKIQKKPEKHEDESVYTKRLKFKKFLANAEDSTSDETRARRPKQKRKLKKGGDKYTTTKKPRDKRKFEQRAFDKGVTKDKGLVIEELTTTAEAGDIKHREKRKISTESESSLESKSERKTKFKKNEDKNVGKRDPKFERKFQDPVKSITKKDVPKKRDETKLEPPVKATPEASLYEAYEDKSKVQLPSEEYSVGSESTEDPQFKVGGKDPNWSQYIDDYEAGEEEEGSEGTDETSKSGKTSPKKSFKKLIEESGSSSLDKSLKSDLKTKAKSFKKTIAKDKKSGTNNKEVSKPVGKHADSRKGKIFKHKSITEFEYSEEKPFKGKPKLVTKAKLGNEKLKVKDKRLKSSEASSISFEKKIKLKQKHRKSSEESQKSSSEHATSSSKEIRKKIGKTKEKDTRTKDRVEKHREKPGKSRDRFVKSDTSDESKEVKIKTKEKYVTKDKTRRDKGRSEETQEHSEEEASIDDKHKGQDEDQLDEEEEEERNVGERTTWRMPTKPKKVRKFELPKPPVRNGTKTLLGTRSFYDLVTQSDTFVDKTDFINDILCDEKILHFTRPKKWGRTITIDMLKRFFELELDDYGNHLYENEKVNKKLFRGGIKVDLMPELNEISTPRLRRKKKKLAALDAIRYRVSPPLKISQDSKAMMHLGKYPVMLFNFKNLRGESSAKVTLAFKNLIFLQFKRYSWLLKKRIGYANKKMFVQYLKMNMPDEQFIKTGIGFLTKMIHKIFKKRVVFFIDNEDFPVLNYLKDNYFDTEGLRKIHKMAKEFITKLTEDPNIHQGIIFGTLHIKQTEPAYLSELYMPYSVNDPSYNTLLGFTDHEVDKLLANRSLPVTKRDLKKWYSGYNMGGKEMYNPWSVLNCIHNGGKLEPYFTERRDTRVLRKGIPREVIMKLIHDEGVSVAYLHQLANFDYIRTYQVFIKSLMHTGYLTQFKNKLYIPNKEIYNFFSNGTYYKRLNQTRSVEQLEIRHRKEGI